MIAALKSAARWLWMVVLAVVAVTCVFRSRSAEKRAERAHAEVQKHAMRESADRWKQIDRNLAKADKAEDRAQKRKADAEKALDAISAQDPDMRDLLNRYNSRRVRERPGPAKLES